jgi:hypothetical protein
MNDEIIAIIAKKQIVETKKFVFLLYNKMYKYYNTNNP